MYMNRPYHIQRSTFLHGPTRCLAVHVMLGTYSLSAESFGLLYFFRARQSFGSELVSYVVQAIDQYTQLYGQRLVYALIQI